MTFVEVEGGALQGKFSADVFDAGSCDMEDLAGTAQAAPYHPQRAVPCLDASSASRHLSTEDVKGVLDGQVVFVTHAFEPATGTVRKFTERERRVLGIN